MRQRTQHRLIAARPLAVEASLIITAYLAYEVVRRIVVRSPVQAIDRAMSLIRIEQRLGIFYEPNLQRFVIHHQWLVTMFNWIYIWGYLPVIGIAALYLYTRHHEFYTRYRNAFLLSGAIGLIIFATLPVAPPRMFPEFGFIDTVRGGSPVYGSVEGRHLVNEFAAVPSFHFGWILLVSLALFQSSKVLMMRVGATLLPVMMLLTILFTANHYLIDALAGGTIVLLALAAVRLVEKVHDATLPMRERSRSHG